MNNFVKQILAVLVVGLMLATPVIATDSNFAISDVSFDDPVAPGQNLAVTVTLENSALTDNALTDNVHDITVKAWLENSKHELVGTRSSQDIVKVHPDTEKDLTFNIAVPSDTDAGTYTLQVTAKGEWENADQQVSVSWNGPVEVEQAEHGFAIQDVQLSANSLSAGDALDVAVTVLNNGQNDESGITVKAAIPELGVEQSIKLIKPIAENDQVTQYLTLQLPEKVKDGLYTVKVTVYNDKAGASAQKDLAVENAAVVAKPTGAVTQPALGVQTIQAGKGAIFSMQVANNANTAKTFGFTVGGAGDWASNVRVDPTVLTLGAGESETVQVHMIPTESGEHSFTLFVSDGSTTIAGQQVKVAVSGGLAGSEGSVGQNLIILLIFVLIAAFAYWKYQTGETVGTAKKQIYY